MTTKTKDTKNEQKRTQVKDLPKSQRRLNQKEMKKLKGGTVGPCDRERGRR